MKVQAIARGAEDGEAYTRLWEGLDLPRLEALLPERNPRPSRTGRYLMVTCPQCGLREAWLYPAKEGKGPKLHCNRKNQCGWEQRLWDYCLERNRGDKRATYRELAQAAGVPVEDRPASGPQARRRKPLKPLLPPVPAGTQITPDTLLSERQAQYQQAFMGSPAAAYAARRGVSPERAEAAGLGYAVHWLGWGGERLTYPLHDAKGQLVGIEGRNLEPHKNVRFDGQKGAGVFWAGPERSFEGLHLVEGPFDALALREIGVNAVAVCGTACPEWFLKRLAFRKVWLAFDADAAGDKADTYAAELARYGTTAYRLRPPDEGRDWGDYLQAGGKEAVREAYLRAGGSLPEAMDAKPADACRFCGAEVERYSADGQPSCESCQDRDPEAVGLVATVAAVRQRLAGPGWVAIESKTLVETVLFVRDRKAEVPDRWQKAVRYTLDELGELRGKDPEGLKLVHEVKRVMGGEIVPEEGLVENQGKGVRIGL